MFALQTYTYICLLLRVLRTSDGGWKHTEGGFQIAVADKRAFRAMAKRLYAKWGENMPMDSIVIREW